MHVFLIAAITLDGFIARTSTHISTSWTSQEDKKWFNQRTKEAKVMIMGSKTFDTIGRSLPQRLSVVMTSKLEKYSTDDPNLIFTTETPLQILKMLEDKGYDEVAICGGSSIYTLFMNAGLIDTLYLTVEPVVFGQGVSLFNDDIEASLELITTTHLSNQTLLLEYRVNKSF